MAHSASFVSIPPLSSSHFQNCVQLAVAQNAIYVPPHDAEALLYIRPVVFGSSAEVALCPPEEFTFCVYVQPGHSYHGVRPLDALILEGFDRAAPNGTGTAKVGGNYAPVMRWSGKARSEGYGITLHLDSKTQTEIDEFSTSGFVGVRTEGDDHTLVVPDSSSVIESVTSDSCLQVAKSLGWKVEKRSIKYEELPLFSEVMAVGTAAALLPIKSITRKSTSDKFVYQHGADQPGPCTAKLSDTIKGIQKGKIEDTFGWCVRVEETKLDEPKLDVQMSGDANVEAPKTDEQIVDADVTVDEKKANEEPEEDARMNGHAVVGDLETEEQLKVEEKASGVVRVEEPIIVEEAKIEETRTECVNVEDAKAEEAPKTVEQTDGYVGAKEARFIEALAVVEKIRNQEFLNYRLGRLPLFAVHTNGSRFVRLLQNP